MNRFVLDLVIPYIHDIHTFYMVLDAIDILPLDTKSIKYLKVGTLCFGYDARKELDELVIKGLRIRSIFILEWACSRLGPPPHYYPNPYTAEWRCRYGDLDILKWLYERKYVRELGDRAMTVLFEEAHIYILDWIETTDIKLARRDMPYLYAMYWQCDYITYWLYRNCHRNRIGYSWQKYFDDMDVKDSFIRQLGAFWRTPEWFFNHLTLATQEHLEWL